MRLGVLCGLAFCAYGTAQADSVPDSAEQSRIVALVRQYAAAYQTPDVAFDRTITEFRENEGSVKWRKTFTLYSNRFAHQGVEYWRAAQKDGKPSSGGRWKRAGYPREHDSFEAMLKSTLIWDKWDVLRGRRTAVLTYRVLQRDSINALNLCIRDCKDDPAYVPYSGSLYVDPATGSIWRLSEVVDAPAARYEQILPAGQLGVVVPPGSGVGRVCAFVGRKRREEPEDVHRGHELGTPILMSNSRDRHEKGYLDRLFVAASALSLKTVGSCARVWRWIAVLAMASHRQTRAQG